MVKPVNFGDNAPTTSVSIERSGGRGKRFYRAWVIGLNSCRHDGKMTENRGATIMRNKICVLALPGIRLGKAADRFPGVGDSQNEVSALAPKRRRWRRVGTLPKPVNAIFHRKKSSGRRRATIFFKEKGGPGNEPAFFTGTVTVNFSIGSPSKATRTETDEFLGRIVARVRQRQHALQQA